MLRLRGILLAAVGIALVGCELEEVVVPSPSPIVIVQAVARPDQPQQWVLVERSFSGTENLGQPPFIPGVNPPAVPVEGAAVTMSNLNFPADPCGATVTMLESAGPPARRQPGIYWSGTACPTMRPGDTLELRIVADEDVVTGRTVVPGANQITLTTADGSVTMPGPEIGRAHV